MFVVYHFQKCQIVILYFSIQKYKKEDIIFNTLFFKLEQKKTEIHGNVMSYINIKPK